MDFNHGRRGQEGMVAAIVGTIVGVIVIFSALLPILNSQIGGGTAAFNASNISGYTGVNTIAQTLPLFVVLGALLLIVSGFLFLRK